MVYRRFIPTNAIAVATRTLLAAGFIVTGSERHPSHVEIYCERASTFGASVRYLFAITPKGRFDKENLSGVDSTANSEGRTAVFVGPRTDKLQIGWDVFLARLGGAIPSWRALGKEYGDHLKRASLNQPLAGLAGEAWQIFEDLVGDGLEFCLGRRVRRFGGRKRGQAVSDMVAQFPDLALEVIDAKSARRGFDAQWTNLRALVEYTRNQKARQTGNNEVFGALIVSSSFKQKEQSLLETSIRFYAETSTVLAFLSAETLSEMVRELRNQTDMRNSLHWRRILAGGLVSPKGIRDEIRRAKEQRYRGVD